VTGHEGIKPRVTASAANAHPFPAPPALDVASVYRDQRDYVARSLVRLGIPAAQLEDACHDVFVVVHRRADDYDGACHIRTWLYGITRRVASDRRRSRAREQRFRGAMAALGLPTCTSVERGPAHVLLGELFDRLDEDKRQALVLFELEQLTANEVALRLGINANTASARLRAARREVAVRLAEAEPVAIDAPLSLPRATRRARLALVLPFRQGAGLLVAKIGGSFAAAAVLALASMPIVTAMRHDDQQAVRAHVDVAQPPRAMTPRPIAMLRERVVAPQLPVMHSSSVVADQTRPATRTLPRRAHTPGPAATEASVAAAPVPAADDLAEQNRLARNVVQAADAESALRSAERYRERFPRGFFVASVAAHEITALCELGRIDDAERRRDALAIIDHARATRAFRTCRGDSR
jgi:RNA polymerase sigma-70 factor (ECF subfamily)